MIIAKDGKEHLIIIQPENLARMKVGDPITIPDLGITICYEELPDDKLIEAMNKGSRKYLFRGYQEHPDDFQDPIYKGTKPR